MAKSPSPEDDSIKHYKPKAKGLSFFASIFSLFICISIFYILNLSPYHLFNNNIFWFFMSNTLFLIIAADYGAFSSANEKQDLYEEYVKQSHQQQPRNSAVPSDVPIYEPVLDEKGIFYPKQEPENKDTATQETEIPERAGLEIVVQNDPKKPNETFSSTEKKPPVLPLQEDDSKACDDEVRTTPTRTYRRSKSDRPDRHKRVVNIDERKNTVRRSETMKMESRAEEENEFSGMTDEELNKRVEDFIQRFNRQIRLQAARNIHQI